MSTSNTLSRLSELAKEKSSERRRELMRQVTDLFFESPPAEGSPLQGQFDGILSAIAQETAADARRELSDRFADAAQAPRGLIMQLARDAIEVARPILERSARLNEDDLLRIVHEKGEAHMRAISGRAVVPEKVSEIIVEKGDDHTVARLVGNEGAQLSRAAHETVAKRAETSPVLQAPLAQRSDTPPDLLHDLMMVVETSLRERIMSRFEAMEDGAVEAALAASRARLEKRLSEDRDIAEARKWIQQRQLRKELDGALLARLLRERETVKFCVGFAELTGLDYHAARRAVEHEDIDLLALVCKASGFDRAIFVTFAVLRSGAKSDGMAQAREMGQLYDGIDPEAAQRTLRFWRMRKEMAAA
ncbi:DUF2336 domain-containing protein [Glycocaulis profundi]|nr:DUF2336 domain-containing protein [Glycocaulis profundi]